jgi:hypothetical protein
LRAAAAATTAAAATAAATAAAAAKVSQHQPPPLDNHHHHSLPQASKVKRSKKNIIALYPEVEEFLMSCKSLRTRDTCQPVMQFSTKFRRLCTSDMERI